MAAVGNVWCTGHHIGGPCCSEICEKVDFPKSNKPDTVVPSENFHSESVVQQVAIAHPIVIASQESRLKNEIAGLTQTTTALTQATGRLANRADEVVRETDRLGRHINTVRRELERASQHLDEGVKRTTKEMRYCSVLGWSLLPPPPDHSAIL